MENHSKSNDKFVELEYVIFANTHTTFFTKQQYDDNGLSDLIGLFMDTLRKKHSKTAYILSVKVNGRTSYTSSVKISLNNLWQKKINQLA